MKVRPEGMNAACPTALQGELGHRRCLMLLEALEVPFCEPVEGSVLEFGVSRTSKTSVLSVCQLCSCVHWLSFS